MAAIEKLGDLRMQAREIVECVSKLNFVASCGDIRQQAQSLHAVSYKASRIAATEIERTAIRRSVAASPSSTSANIKRSSLISVIEKP